MYRRPNIRRTYRKKTPAITVKKRVPLARKRTVMANTRAIKSLSKRMYGSIQCSLVKNVENLRVDQTHPILWDISDATCVTITPAQQGGGIYQRQFVAPNDVAIVSHFQSPPNLASNPFTKKWQIDRPGSGKYLLEHVNMVICLEGRPNLGNKRVRFQVFTAKGSALVPNPASAPSDSLVLPDALEYLNHLADFSASPNLLPAKYFRTLYDRTVVINSAPANTPITGGTQATHPTTLNKRYIRFSYRRPRLITQSTTYPVVQSLANATPVTELTGGWYGPLNRSLNSPVWAIISCDDTDSALNPGSLSVTISKYSKWRDPTGAY